MARQQFMQPRPNRRQETGSLYDDSWSPGRQTNASNPNPVSQEAASTLADIDNVLNEVDSGKNLGEAGGPSSHFDDSSALNNREEDGGTPPGQESDAAEQPPSEDSSNRATNMRAPKWLTKKRAGIAGAVLGLVCGGGAITILPSTLQSFSAIHYSKLLMKPFASKDNNDSGKLGKMLWYSRTRGPKAIGKSAVAASRLGVMDQYIADFAVKDYQKVGVRFTFDDFGRLSVVSLDPSKNPEFSRLTPSEAKTQLAQTLGVDPAKINGNAAGGTMRVNVRSSNIDTSTLRSFFNEHGKLTGRGKIASWQMRRVLLRYTNLPSAFHPFQRAKNALDNRIIDAVSSTKAYRKAEEARAKAAAKLSPDGQKILAGLKEQVNGVSGKVGTALLVTAAVCTAYDIANRMPEINQELTVLPAIGSAMDALGVGGQAESGDDITLEQIDAYNANHVDSSGRSSWDSADIHYLSGEPGGVVADESVRQAFSETSTAQQFKDGLEKIGAAQLCSDVGLAAQLVVGITLVAVGPGGWVAKATTTATGAAVGVVAMNVISRTIERFLGPKAVEYISHKGPLGGTMDALGARAAANASSFAAGGSFMSSQASNDISKTIATEEKAAFQKQNLLSRLFNTRDEQSLLSQATVKVAMGMSGRNNVPAELVQSIAQLPGSVVSPWTKAYAADTPASPPLSSLAGFTQTEEANQAIQDPFSVGDKAAELLSGPNGRAYIERSLACFGDTIAKNSSGLWDVTMTKIVNPASKEYQDANCGEKSASFLIIRKFIDYTTWADGFLCSHDKADSCAKISGSMATAPTTASQTSNMGDLSADSTGLTCYDNPATPERETRDLGTADGYRKGVLVPIRICAVAGFRSSSAESNGGYGVVGANGDVIVNARVSKNVADMFAAAKNDTTQGPNGLIFTAVSSFRTMAHQQDLCRQNALCTNGDGRYVAVPGNSNHQMGLAIDFAGTNVKTNATSCTSGRARDPGSQVWRWLENNAGKFSYRQYMRESWHWDPAPTLDHCGGMGGA